MLGNRISRTSFFPRYTSFPADLRLHSRRPPQVRQGFSVLRSRSREMDVLACQLQRDQPFEVLPGCCGQCSPHGEDGRNRLTIGTFSRDGDRKTNLLLPAHISNPNDKPCNLHFVSLSNKRYESRSIRVVGEVSRCAEEHGAGWRCGTVSDTI
jgi:hypothetical protein